MTLTVKPIPILDDNYAWFLRDEATGMTAVIDAAVVEPIADFIAAEGGRLDWLLITHHHGDHIAGIPELAQRTGAKIAGAAADAARLPKLDVSLKPGDTFALGDSVATILDSPGRQNRSTIQRRIEPPRNRQQCVANLFSFQSAGRIVMPQAVVGISLTACGCH